MTEKSTFQETYMRAVGAVAFVTIIDGKGDEGIGSAFHIGQGIFVTARHVIEGVMIKEIATTKSARLSEEAGGKGPRRADWRLSMDPILVLTASTSRFSASILATRRCRRSPLASTRTRRWERTTSCCPIFS